MAKQRSGSIKRFGVRYGRTVKAKVAKAEAEMKGWQRCPYCTAMKVKRLSMGIWHCRKCDAKFTGRAYTVATKVEAGETHGKV